MHRVVIAVLDGAAAHLRETDLDIHRRLENAVKDVIPRHVWSCLLPLGQYLFLQLLASLVPAALDFVGGMHLEQGNMVAWYSAEEWVKEGLAGGMPAKIVSQLACYNALPMGQELVGTLYTEQSHEGLADPGVIAGILRALLGGNVQCVVAPLVVLPALHRLLQRSGQIISANKVKKGGVGVESRDDGLGSDGVPLGGLDADSTTVLHDDFAYLGGIQNYPPRLDNLPYQGASKLVRPAVAVALVHATVEKQGDKETDSALLGVKSPHATGIQQQSTDFVVLKGIGYDFQRAKLSEFQHLAADVGAVQSDAQLHRRLRR